MADEQHTPFPLITVRGPDGAMIARIAPAEAIRRFDADERSIGWLVSGEVAGHEDRSGRSFTRYTADDCLRDAAPSLFAACRVALQRLNPVYGPGREVPTVDHAIAALAEAIASATKPTGKDEK